MEMQTQGKENFTDEKDKTKQACMRITAKEAEEYCAYKRQKKISEIMSSMRRSESVFTEGESAVKLLEKGVRLRQAALQIQPSALMGSGEILTKCPIAVDCVIGGNGETLPKVKAYEAKCALRMGVKELTLVVTPSWLMNGRYGELRKEIKKIKRVARRALLKVRVERPYPLPTLSRLARMSSDLGAAYFSVPYFTACEGLKTELSHGCHLEISGVDNLALYQKMIEAGVGRIQTSRAWEIYSEWLLEAEKISLSYVEERVEEKDLLVEAEEKTLEETFEVKKEEEISLPTDILPTSKALAPIQALPPVREEAKPKLEVSDFKFI